jgi:hypothetical protein
VRWDSITSVLLASAVLGVMVGLGCQKSEVGAPSEQEQASQKALADLLKYAQETGQTLEQLQQTLAQWRAAQQQEARVSPVETDLKVLRSLLATAQGAIENKSVDTSLAVLKRMNRVARGLLAELPGQRIALRVERALAALTGEAPEARAASEAILSALDASLNAPEAALVPNVASDLEAAKSAVASDAKAATQALLTVLDKCGRDRAATWAYYIVTGLDGAFEAVQREAWPVAKAELEQVAELIKKIEAAVAGGQPQAEQAPAAQSQAQQPAASEAAAGPQGGALQPSGQQPQTEAPAVEVQPGRGAAAGASGGGQHQPLPAGETPSTR